MKPSLNTFKRKFDRELKHIKYTLAQERRRMPVQEWLDLVKQTKEWILKDPETFFGPELPTKAMICEAVDKVFEGFLEDQRLLANQTSKRFKIPFWLKAKSPRPDESKNS